MILKESVIRAYRGRNRYDRDIIFTRADGTQIERPILPQDANAEDRIAHMRALFAYNDEVTDFANSSFDKAFRKAMK